MSKKATSFGNIVALMGSILIALGIAWQVAWNWSDIPSVLKIIILFAVTAGAYTSGTILRTKNYRGIGSSLIALGSLLYTLSIFLIAQIFATSESIQGTAWLLFLAWAGVIAAAYIFKSSISLTIALVELIIWVFTQYMAFSDLFGGKVISPGILAFYFLSIGILVYGLSLWHRIKGLSFARIYQWWTAFYFLAFTYVLSFQTLLPWMWPSEAQVSVPAMIFLFFLAIIALVVSVSGIIAAGNKSVVKQKEITGVFLVAVLLALSIGLTGFVSTGQNYYDTFRGSSSVPLSLWMVWIVINVLFILLILGVIAYGKWQKLGTLVNLGIFAFALDIITRYIGFMMDLWGYTSLSVVFISGGILLVGGGWLLEKWRRKLVV